MIMPMLNGRFRCVVVDVDTQRHFFSSGSGVCVRRHRQVLANILRVVKWACERRICRISTLQTVGEREAMCAHGVPIGFDDGKIRYTIRGRCLHVEASDSTDLPTGLLSLVDQVIMSKRCYDPFEEPRLDRTLSELRADEFILIGAATEGAVKATALGLLSRGKNVTVVSDATGSYDSRNGQLALRVMEHRGAHVISTSALLGNHVPQPVEGYLLQWR